VDEQPDSSATKSSGDESCEQPPKTSDVYDFDNHEANKAKVEKKALSRLRPFLENIFLEKCLGKK
jgi:hypothetical protein